jgi:hypothetical protein
LQKPVVGADVLHALSRVIGGQPRNSSITA